MQLQFFKYQGTGNDFIMIDNRSKNLSKNNTNLVKKLCDRKFGIGADGLILLENPENSSEDFKMIYFNSDGNEGSMCGNGGRCIIAFANFVGLIERKCTFSAIDGLHEGFISEKGMVSLKMKDVEKIKEEDNFIFLDTGSPHHIVFEEDIDALDIQKEGFAIRFSERYEKTGGTNVNFVAIAGAGLLKIRTYERGVEAETLSCGTGAVAAALAAFSSGRSKTKEILLETQGGKLKVEFESKNGIFTNILLSGPVEQVFKGSVEC